MVKEAKKEDLVSCGKELQEDFLRNRRKFWKKVKGKEEVQKCGLGVKSENGTLLTEQREVRNRWKEYFRGLLDGEVSEADVSSCSEERDGCMAEEITEEKIRREIWKLTGGKASGVCNIQGKVLKAGTCLLLRVLTVLLGVTGWT